MTCDVRGSRFAGCTNPAPILVGQCKGFCEEVIKSSERIMFSEGTAESQHGICKPYILVEPPACSGGLFCSNSSDLLW